MFRQCPSNAITLQIETQLRVITEGQPIYLVHRPKAIQLKTNPTYNKLITARYSAHYNSLEWFMSYVQVALQGCCIK